MAEATFAAGCFWGVEAAFRQVQGVLETTVGYSGGEYDNPSYKDVCTGKTGHAEVVRVKFDPERVSYEELLDVFWSEHNPTTKNRQGWDIGTQYRSAIFYHDEEQKQIAEEVIREVTEEEIYDAPIVTEVTAFEKFYAAEDYHQEYFANNPNQPYCAAVVAPKVSKFRQKFLTRLKK